MIHELHVLVSRTPDGAYMSTISGAPALSVRAPTLEDLRARTVELVRENLDRFETLEAGAGPGTEGGDGLKGE
jgi:hypothetical protein